MLKVSVEMKASMTKAVLAASSGFKDMMNNMELKMKALLQDKVHVGFFDASKAQIADLADRAAKQLVDVYDGLARKSVNDAIIKVNDLLIAVYVVEKSNQNADALSTVRSLAETESQAVKDAIHSQQANSEESVAVAMKNAADQMVLDYNDLARIVNNVEGK
ncbi:hypothetical protein OS493_001046 [Desmophyllum pertusum]|uniref:Uncharacterized protein n=1 Tax=Desmophyllum pertusum TaxID=174260 RepID=A0A9X0D7G1_9CNID|nr:hypothetical protein OS493_001046 [Desmophyllum pertusum]